MLLSPEASPLAGRRVLFVSGKGGVGKTTVASAIAAARARQGERVLLVSTDPAHNLGHLWDVALGDGPTSVGGDDLALEAIEIDPEQTVSRHLAAVGSTMRRWLPERLHGAAERHLELARTAPGTHEAAILERVAEVVGTDTSEHDLVVLDTAPTGHTLRLMALPEQLTTWTEALLANRDRAERFGAALTALGGDSTTDRDAELRRLLVQRHRRFANLRDVVTDPRQCGFVLVTTAERLPVLETQALARRLQDLGIDVPAVVVNRRSPSTDGELLATRRRAEDEHLTTLRASTSAELHEVPLLAAEPVGEQGVATVAGLLGA